MAARFDVQNIDYDPLTFARSCRIRLGTGRVSFEAPYRIGSGNNTDAEIYEAYRGIRPETVQKSLESEKYCREVDRGLDGLCRGGFNVLFLEYMCRGNSDGGGKLQKTIPTPKMVEHLSNIQYSHSDAIVTPSWFSLVGDRNDKTDVDLYLNLTDEYIDAAERLNNKPIIVSIPQCIPPERIGDVLMHYAEKGIAAYCVDSNSRSLIDGTWVRTFRTAVDGAMREYGSEEKYMVLSINAFQGIVGKQRRSTDAKDFLGFSAGMDVICGKHTKAYGGGDSDNTNDSTVARIFQPETYNYINRVCKKDEKKEIQDESVRLQILEMPNVRKSIRNGELKDLLESKDISDETMNGIYRIRGTGMRGVTALEHFI